MTQSVTGTAGAIAAGVNVSIARNRATNDAIIKGRELKASSVTLGSYGKGTAGADMTGVSVGGIKITASVVDALNETTNRARMDLSGSLDGSLLAESSVTGETAAKLTTGGGSLVGIDTNVATAYGKTNAVTDVSIGGAADGRQSITAKATGKDTVSADIDNLIGLNAISVATMVGAAHAQDVYSAKVKLADGSYDTDSVTVETESDINVTSTVTPSSTGVNLSAGSLGVNVSSATSTAYAGAELALENAKLTAEKDVNIRTTTSAKAEADSIRHGAYFYPEDAVWLTGLPRFDRLYHDEKRCITIMPTWRRALSLMADPKTGERKLREGFEQSEFYRFYQGLLTDRRLLDAAKTYGYTVRFLPHPTLQPHIGRFDTDGSVELLSASTPYRKVFAESDLIVTDYSSVAFDVAYLRKPVVYAQFDRESFYSGEHVYVRGYFEHERDGFGEVETDLAATVDRLIEYMQNGCRLKDKYRARIEAFFAFDDSDNCRRVYEKLRELQKE